jgi:hypothetical protein
MSPEATIEFVEPSRLTFVATVELPPYHYAAIFRR